jgi:heme exporter protein C
MLHRWANPTRFLRVVTAIQPWSAAVAAGAIAIGLYFAILASPPDYQQGETVRIMYVHVPSAWMAMAMYTVMAGASAAALVWRHPVAEVTASAAAPIGAVFTVVCLATGSLWGRPMWGAWWVWDARLTSVLVLLFLYVGFMALESAFDEPERGARAAGILAIVGLINLPIIKFSVDWWNTLHQPASVTRLAAPAIHPEMLTPLLTMAGGFSALGVTLLILRVRIALAERRERAMTQFAHA